MLKFNFFLVILLLLSSCSSKRDILYLQNLSSTNLSDLNYEEHRVRVDDILKIVINSSNNELLYSLNPLGLNQNIAQNKESLLYNGYLVDNSGYIHISQIGKVFVMGLTLNDIRDKIKEKLITDELILDATIDVRLLNSYFTVLGEVNKPGRYDFVENNINIFEAIGMAGDLTISGKRDNIKIIREFNGKKTSFVLNLTNSDFLNDKNKYQVFAGDIIIVSPNNARIKNAGIIGNSGTLVSLLSFLLSSIIVINN